MRRAPSIIYKMIHIPTGKFYIGSLKDSSRFSTYVTSSKYVSRMMRDNPEEWDRYILETFADVPFQEVVLKEQLMIEESVKTLGWDGVWNKYFHVGVANCYSPETREKSNAAQLREDVRKKKSEAMKITMNAPEMRSHLAELTRIQMSKPGAGDAVAKANAKRVHSDETRRRLSESHKNILHTKESKAKIAAAHIGRKKMLDNEGKDRRVKQEDIEKRISEGWTLVVGTPD